MLRNIEEDTFLPSVYGDCPCLPIADLEVAYGDCHRIDLWLEINRARCWLCELRLPIEYSLVL